MKLCIPVCEPKGLESLIEPHLPAAEHLLFFDVETRRCEHVSLRDQDAGAGCDIEMDAVLCGSINRMVLRQLLAQGIQVYGVDTQTVAEAIARFEAGELEAAVLSGGCGGHGGHGGCGGHGDGGHGGCGGHGEHGGGCCSGAEHGAHGGGCHGEAGGGCCGGHAAGSDAAVFKERGAHYRIAVCSQNRKTVTEHAGKCRKFWIFEIDQGRVAGRMLLELPIEQALHSTPPGQPHPLDGVAVLLTASAGSGLTQRLAQRGIECVLTAQTDLESAVAEYLAACAEPAAAAS